MNLTWKTIGNILLFLFWPLIVPFKTLFKGNFLQMFGVFLGGAIWAIVMLVLVPTSVHFFVFLAIMLLIGSLWGYHLASGTAPSDKIAEIICTCTAGMLWLYALQIILSRLHIFLVIPLT
jgi:hypothetical protein